LNELESPGLTKVVFAVGRLDPHHEVAFGHAAGNPGCRRLAGVPAAFTLMFDTVNPWISRSKGPWL
jgi:hypothetical protein